MNSQNVAGRAPMPAQRGTIAHSSGGGFCTVCGTVWPCSQAATDAADRKADENVGSQQMANSSR